MTRVKPLHVAILSDHLRSLSGQGGGVDRCQWRLANEYARQGHRVDVVVFDTRGIDTSRIPSSINLVALSPSGNMKTKLFILRHLRHLLRSIFLPILLPLRPNQRLRYLPGLTAYLRRSTPDIFISAGTYENVVSLLANAVTGYKTPILVSERNPLSEKLKKDKHANKARWKHLPPLLNKLYPKAAAVVAISHTLRDDLTKELSIDPKCFATIYNPVIDNHSLQVIETALPPHRWLGRKDYPVIVCVGRLRKQKDYPTILRALAHLKKTSPHRLIIVGDGPEKKNLKNEAEMLGVSEDVDFVGYKENALEFIASADVFVLCSIYEGLPAVLIEALAAGAPIVSTDCPGSSAEILANGRYGVLVPPRDPEALADGIKKALNTTLDPRALRQRGRQFTVELASHRYLEAAGLDTGNKRLQPQP